ncbi:VOC family protein [Sphingobium sufflavum]|uniref:VOC family protein n=1 Tax=Sphingobium sufflavum TaxID=1129547 RepID=UPI001F3606DB|nr:VOC family protein [Sphingobium sufflavum]MCE7798619.1 VOC family protein [Sphingobium sufflavum]
MTGNMTPPPLRFYSIVLAVADLSLMQHWYARALGFAERLSGASEADGTAFAVMDGAGTCIELVARRGATPAPPPEPPTHLDTTGWRTLDLESDDLLALDAHLRREGVTILTAMQPLSPRRAMTVIRDPEGNLIAIFGPVPG